MDFKFIQNLVSGKWVISAPKRSKRPNELKGTETACPFCPGQEKENPEIYRIPARHASAGVAGGPDNSDSADWKVRVVANKFPFAPIHEIIIHSPDHHKSFDELPLEQTKLILKTFKNRFLEHKDKGQVYIFTNHGQEAGESLPHPHSQLVVIPDNVSLEFPHHELKTSEKFKETGFFNIFCPHESSWPDEIWLYPKQRGKHFFEISDEEIQDLSKNLYKLIQIFDLRHGHEFPYNISIYPGIDWYLRIIPRIKIIGGFEVGTNVFVNTQDPAETMEFILEHFETPNEEKIKGIHRARYHRFS